MFYGQADQTRQPPQFNFDDAYNYLKQQLQRYRNIGDFVPPELRPTDNRLLNELDQFTQFAIDELPHFWATTTKNKLVAVIEAVMQDRQLGATGCALSVFVAGAFKLRYQQHSISDRNAFEEAMLLFGAWFAAKNRWRLNMDRQAEEEFYQHANAFEGLISSRGNGRGSGNNNRNYGDSDRVTSGFNLNQAKQEVSLNTGRTYDDQVARMNQQNQQVAYVPPPNLQRNTMPQQALPQPEAVRPTLQQSNAVANQAVLTAKPLSSGTWTNKKLSHPPAWYGKAVAAMIDNEGNVSMTPASLSLPPDTPAILRLGDTDNFGEGPAFDVSALVTMVGFTDKIITVPATEDMFTVPAKYAAAGYSKPNTVAVSLRAKRWELCSDFAANRVPLERIRGYFHKPDTTVVDLVTYMKHIRNAKNETDIILSDTYYWNVNNICSDAFRLMSELMLGIDPYTLRLGCFGPTGKPEDDNDVEQFLTYLHQTMGSTYTDMVTSPAFARIFAELVFPSHPTINSAVAAEVKAAGDGFYSAPFAIERYAFVSNINLLNDLRMVKWCNVGHHESPYGYAPARIDKAVCPALYDLAQGVLDTHKDYNVPMAVLNFGYGKLIVTKAFIGGGLVAKWVTFVN